MSNPPATARKTRRTAGDKMTQAQGKVGAARKAGIIVPSDTCERCGCREQLMAHHDDYERPLDVIWLCRRCHTRHHLENGPGKNDIASVPHAVRRKHADLGPDQWQQIEALADRLMVSVQAALRIVVDRGLEAELADKRRVSR